MHEANLEPQLSLREIDFCGLHNCQESKHSNLVGMGSSGEAKTMVQ